IVMLPLLLAVYIGLAAIQAPNSSLSVWSSMAPFTSPVVMPVRLPTDPPGWQIMISMIIAIAFAIGMVWFAGRIYRVGILMYGKKASLKELAKWLFYQP
ncbi:MAG: ABC transporter permease, partial [Gammaproteobacteria bacterium]|nr:ABC transporter permease [Gammaproteobacteria bacterium]NIW44858.1 ABC transporter permease [Gammaproteobacteria bacterium]NIX56020.1 ABC transporter permease [candidate division Zixibacteria bacterium]